MKKKLFIKLCFSLNFKPLDPDPRIKLNADPTGSTSLVSNQSDVEPLSWVLIRLLYV